MTLGLKIISGLYAALLLLLGGRWWFSFDGILKEWSVEAIGPIGINNLTADMGSLFLGGAIMIALGLWKNQGIWLLAVAILMAIAALGRILVYATAGYAPETLIPLIFEVASCAILVLTARAVTNDESVAAD